MSQITYNDKVENEGATNEGLVFASNMNEIKSSVNDNDDRLVILENSISVGGEVVFIFSVDDFPTPVADVITLDTENTIYRISGDVDIGVNRLVIAANNVKLEGGFSPVDKITSSASGVAVISSANFSVSAENLTISGVNSTYLIEVDGTGTEEVSLKENSFTNCNDIARINSVFSVTISGRSNWDNFTNGFLFQGTITLLTISNSVSQLFTGNAIDLGGSVISSVDINNNTSLLTNGSEVFLTIAANGANISSGGKGDIRGNKVIESVTSTATSGYSPFDVEWESLFNTSNILPSDRLEPEGWGFYVDDAVSNIVVSTTPTRLTINGLGAGSNETKLPLSIRGVDSLWNISTNLVEGVVEGDSYDLRIQCNASSSSGGANNLILKLDIGSVPDGTGVGNSIIIATDSKRIDTPANIVFTFPIFTLNTFIANGGALFLESDAGTFTVSNRDILIIRESSGAN